MQVVRVRRSVCVVSRHVHEAALAITIDGTLLLGVAHVLRDSTSPEELLRVALEHDGDIFIGVALTETEASLVLMRLDNAGAEAASRLIAARQRRRRPTTRRRRATRS